MALLGWIVLDAARTEHDGFELRYLLRGVRVADVMTPDPVTVPAGLTVDEVVREYLPRFRCSAFPVVDADRTPVGLVTLGSLRAVSPIARASVRIDEVATPMADVAVARPDEPLTDLIGRLTAVSGRHALVLDGDVLVGIVTERDLDRAVEVAGVAGAPEEPLVGAHGRRTLHPPPQEEGWS
jgi:CBS domain-containing protein